MKIENKVSFLNCLCFLSKHHSLFTKKKGHILMSFSKHWSLEWPCEINLSFSMRVLGGRRERPASCSQLSALMPCRQPYNAKLTVKQQVTLSCDHFSSAAHTRLLKRSWNLSGSLTGMGPCLLVKQQLLTRDPFFRCETLYKQEPQGLSVLNVSYFKPWMGFKWDRNLVKLLQK